MRWAKHRIVRLQKKRGTRGFDDRPECREAALRAPSPEADASFRFRRTFSPITKEERLFFF
jgi:hypothetical protein